MKRYTRLPLAIQTRVTITRAKETTSIYLPVGGARAVVLDVRGDRGNSESPTATIRLSGLTPEARAQDKTSIEIGAECGNMRAADIADADDRTGLRVGLRKAHEVGGVLARQNNEIALHEARREASGGALSTLCLLATRAAWGCRGAQRLGWLALKRNADNAGATSGGQEVARHGGSPRFSSSEKLRPGTEGFLLAPTRFTIVDVADAIQPAWGGDWTYEPRGRVGANGVKR